MLCFKYIDAEMEKIRKTGEKKEQQEEERLFLFFLLRAIPI